MSFQLLSSAILMPLPTRGLMRPIARPLRGDADLEFALALHQALNGEEEALPTHHTPTLGHDEDVRDKGIRRPAAAQRTVDEITDHGGTYEIILKLCDYLREQHKAQFMHTRGLGRELQADTLREQVAGVREHAADHEVRELERRLRIREDSDRACNANFGGNKVDICRQIADLMRQAAPIADWKVRDGTWKDRLKDLTGPEIMAVLDEDGIFDIV